jgi:hypothetical protein
VKNNAITYILSAVAIIINNITPLMILITFSLLSLFPLLQETPNVSLFVFASILMLLIYPLIFGQYSQLALNNRIVPYTVILKNHWLNFIIVGFILGIPSGAIEILERFLQSDLKLIKVACSIGVTSLSIYVYPLVFINRQQWRSVKFGFRCALGNFKFNLPIVIIVVISASLGFYIGEVDSFSARYSHTFICVIYTIISWFVDVMVFVSATLILKEKVLTN